MINPILASSARRRMRSVRTPLLVTVYVAVLFAFAYFYFFHGVAKPTVPITQMRKGVETYALLILLQFALLILVAPAMTAGSIAGERERQTLDLLRVTNTGSLSIVLGKLLESFGFLCLLVLSSMPVLCLLLITGGATFGQIIISVSFLLLIALAALSVGLCASALCRRTLTATVVSYLVIFGLGVVTLTPIFVDVKKLGAIYDAASAANTYLQSVDYVPLSFVANPGLGLVALLYDQTRAEVVKSVFALVSQTLTATFHMLPFKQCYQYHMIFLGGFSGVLIALSAWFVRPNRRIQKMVKRKKA